jgi:hypothetical protein
VSDEERTGTCVVCQERDPLPDLTPACGPCRSKVAGQLRDIPALVDELRGEVPADLTEGQERIEEKVDHLVDLDGELAAGVRIEHLHLVDVHAGAVPGQSGAPRVHGSREAPVPISVDRTDLLSDARVLNLTKVYEQQREDQIGYLSAATVLDGWCRDFAETRRESAPEPIPAAQCRYLADRLDWAFNTHPAVDEFAGEVGDLWHTLRRAAGLTMPQPELCAGVPCRRVDCDLKTLYRVPGSDYIECASCGLLLTQDEYAAWCGLLSAAARKTVVPRS